MNDESTAHETPEGEGVPWSPPPLFKYVRLDRALAILESRDIRFTQPRFLNDPHELSVEINPQSLCREFYEHMVGAGGPPERAADIACRNVDSLVIDRVAWVMAELEKLARYRCARPRTICCFERITPTSTVDLSSKSMSVT